MKTATMCLLLLCLVLTPVFGQSATMSLQNPQVSGNQLTVDLYAKNTGSTAIHIVDCSFYIQYNGSKFTSPSVSFALSLPLPYGVDITPYSTTPKTIGIDLAFSGIPTVSNTVQLSSSGNGTKIGTVTISGLTTFTGLADLTWSTTFTSQIFRWDPQTGNSTTLSSTSYAIPPDIYLGPVFDVVLRNQQIGDQQYTFDVFIKRTNGQPFYLGNSTLKIGLNASKFSSPAVTVVSRGTTRLTDYYTYAAQIQNSVLTLSITAPSTLTQADFDSKIQTVSNLLNGTRIATIAVSGLTTPVSVFDIAPVWQTESGATVLRTRRSVSNWTAADDVTANGTFLIEDPDVSLSLTAPNGGQNFCSGTTQQVQWASNNVQRVKLELVPETGTPVTVAASLAATTGTYSWTIPAVAGTFRMRISDPARPSLNDISDNTFSIQIPATLTTHPSSQSVCKGATVTLVSAGTGTPTPAIQWQSSTDGATWQDIAGATGATLVLANVQPAMSGNRYRVKYTNSCAGVLTSSVAVLTVNDAPAFQSTIPSQTVCSGERADFSFLLSGTPMPSIQWQISVDGGSNWSDISGATTSTLSLNNVQLSMNGNLYRAVLSNLCGQNVLSNNAQLIVQAAPAITQHPQSRTACSGETIVLTAAATGTPTPVIEWQTSTDGANWTTVPGGTSPTLTLPGITLAMNGRMYRVVFSNTCRAIPSNPATLTVGSALQITAQPQNITVCEGTGATVIVSASGSPAPSVVWQQSTDGINWTIVPGQSTVMLSLPNVTVAMNGLRFRAILSNFCTQALTTNTITLSVNTAPRITLQPQEVIVCTGETVTYRVEAGGTPAPGIQWQMRPDNTAQWQNMPGQTAAQLQLTAVQSPQNGSTYRAVLTNPCGTVTSDAAALWLLTKPAVTIQPQSVAVCEGATALLQVGALGLPQPAVQWQTSLTGGASWNDVAQATSAVLTVADADRSLDNALFRAVLTNACGSVMSEAVRLTIYTRPEISQQAAGTTACVSGLALFTAAATGNPAPSVRWQSSFDGGAWVDIAGENASTLKFTDIRITQDQVRYRPVYTNLCGEAVGSAATLTVFTAPRITMQPVSKTVVVEESVQFAVSVEGSGTMVYQWYKGGIALQDGGRFSGTKTPQLTITSVQPEDVDHAYYMVASGTCGADTSDFVALNINVPGIMIASQPQAVMICQGGKVEFSITASTDVAGAELSYQWRRGNTELADGGKYSGVHSPVLRITDASAAEAATNYNVRITVQPGGVRTYSNNATLRVDVLPAITASPASVVVCEDGPAFVEVTAVGSGPLQYRWLRHGEPIPNADGPRYVIPAVNSQTTGEYECIVSNGCGSATSGKAVVSLKPGTEIVEQPEDVAGTLGRDFTLELSAAGAGTLAYQWYRNGAPVAGATQETYTNVMLDAASAGEYYCVVRGECGSDTSDTVVVSIVVGIAESGGRNTALEPNYPNPFGDQTTIPVVLADGGFAELVVRDAFGREVVVLHRGFLAAGRHSFLLKAGELPAGVYICTFATKSGTVVRSMVLAR